MLYLNPFTTVWCTKVETMWRIYCPYNVLSQSQWPRGLRHRSVTARLLRLCVRIPLGTWMSVCCECCVLSRTGLCDELITRPEESYRLGCVVVFDIACVVLQVERTEDVKRPWDTYCIFDCHVATYIAWLHVQWVTFTVRCVLFVHFWD